MRHTAVIKVSTPEQARLERLALAIEREHKEDLLQQLVNLLSQQEKGEKANAGNL